MANLCPGYIGVAEIDGKIIRCSDFNVNPNQDFLFYDHVIGLNDTVPTGDATKGEEVGVIQTQKRIGRPSPISIGGSFSFPAATTSSNVNFQDLFDCAKYGDYFDMNFQYHRGSGAGTDNRKFTECRINQFSFSVTASEIVNINVDIFAKDMIDGSGSVSPYTDAEKLITWDKVNISVPSVSTASGIQGIEFSINNNLQNIYTVTPPQTASSVYLPKDIRIGMQEVTGSLMVYNIPGKNFIGNSTQLSKIQLGVLDFNTEINVVFKPQQIPASFGAVITSVPFVGVDKAFGE